MAFMRKLPEEPAILDHFKGGAGSIEKYDILTPDEMYGKGRVCALMKLKPGCEIGRHRHEGDGEVFYILSGRGKYLLNDVLVDVGPGDVLFVDDGEEHFMRCEGEEEMVYFAIVLYSK